MKYKALNYSGIASIEDFDSEVWKSIFHDMEEFQKYFLSKDKLFRSPEYPWPIDALHTFSRIWEYPYVAFNLEEYFKDNLIKDKINVLDFGSGMTFFSYYLASKGFSSFPCDIDKMCEKDFKKANEIFHEYSAKVNFSLFDDKALNFENDFFDSIISVSVLEHLENYETIISEFHRTLKKDGLLILTHDIDLKGIYQLDPSNYLRLKNCLFDHFELYLPEYVIHPLKMLNNQNSLYPDHHYLNKSNFVFKSFKNKIKDILRIPYFKLSLLTCNGLVLVKK